MSYNGSGTFQINTSGQPVVAGTVISSTAFNALTADLATGLSTAITKDGQTTTTARIPFAAGISSTLTTDSSSTTTGSIITAGGAGIAKALYVGTTANVASTTDSSSISTGSIVTAGGVGIAKNLYVGVNANVAGTLGVTGVATFSAAPIYSSLTASSAVATDASKALVSVTNTGTGNNVLATSPTITTPTISQLSSAAATALTLQSAGTTAITVDTSQLVGIGTTSPSSFGGGLVVRKANTGQGVTNATAQFSDATNSALWVGHTSGATNIVADAALTFGYTNGTTTTENARITTGGNVLVGKTALNSATAGVQLETAGTVGATRTNEILFFANRLTTDGLLFSFRQDSTEEGTISVSGTTVSYNGGHLSRYAQTTTAKDNSLVKGTVLSNLDAMNVYTDAEGNPVNNEQLNKVKVSDVEGDVNVAGVFVNWAHDEAHDVDEINMAMTGDMIIRIAQGTTVVRGDLLMSAGNGTAKPQGDDICRSKTIAKVTSNHVTCTYEDGSYCVPCVLMAC